EILGGNPPETAKQAFAAVIAPSGENLLGQVAQYNHDAVTSLQENIAGQLATTQALSRSDLTAAGQAFLSGHPVIAAHDLADADLINAGTTLRIGTELGSFAPNTLGEDLNILGGNGPLMHRLDVAAAATAPSHNLLGQIATNNHSDVVGLEKTIELEV